MITVDIEKVIATGLKEVGQHENPKNSNRQKYGSWYGMNGVAWCAIFISWVFWMSGNALPAIRTLKGFAFCPDIKNWALNNGTYRTGTKGITRGCILLFSFGGVRVDHVALVLGVLPDGRIHTLEGNTDGAGSRTGGIVMEKYRRSNIDGYVVVANKAPTIDWAALRRMLAAKLREQYGATPNMQPGHPNCCEVIALKQSLNLVSGANLNDKDGTYDQATANAVANFQAFMNKAGANIKDFPGAAHEGTRWWLCVALQNIRDGKA